MFGEIVGAWTYEVWRRLGSPACFTLVELGPGTGTLMSDVLRAATRDPKFGAACELWLVEASRPLRAVQAAALPSARCAARLDEVPGGAPTIILANEFLDCLPIRQAVARDGGWRERRIGVTDEGSLAFVEGPILGDFIPPPNFRRDEVWEWSRSLSVFGGQVGKRLCADTGAALFVDYGRARPGPGDTLQALREHGKEDALQNPGLADLTAHVDFPAFAAAAEKTGAVASPIETQGTFLQRLGIERRSDALIRSAPAKREVIERQLQRLISAEGMGEVFKVVALSSPGIEMP